MRLHRTALVALAFSNTLLFDLRESTADQQTATLSPIVVDGSLPYEIEIVEYDFGTADAPTLHSFAIGEHNGLFVLIAGRTNGIHGQNPGGYTNFLPDFQNRDVWVIDLVNKQSWHRSLEDATSGLSIADVDALTPTNNQSYQHGQRLYMTGGYGYVRATGQLNRLRFGASAEFVVADDVAIYDNGVIALDAITGRTTIGYIIGGIVSDSGNNGNTSAAGRIFEVILTPAPTLLADFDTDGNVDGDDFLVWQSGFGMTQGADRSDGDADGDGDVDGDDFLIWQSEFGSTLSGAAASAALPAPAAVGMTVGAVAGNSLRAHVLKKKQLRSPVTHEKHENRRKDGSR